MLLVGFVLGPFEIQEVLPKQWTMGMWSNPCPMAEHCPTGQKGQTWYVNALKWNIDQPLTGEAETRMYNF
jgi:hypothetical protein